MPALASGIVVERYRIVERIGAGAMGEVFLAIDDGLGRKVAFKILSEAHRNNPELRARFVREARAVAAISHPNVVQVFTTGEYDGKPFIAMEYLAGRDLGLMVRERGPLDSSAIAAAIRDAAAGLAAAARAGLIHRDVKPSNLMLLPDGSVKVTDFGLAKPVHAGDDPALTAMGVVVGTPDYIAPEQARGEAIDSRVDVYALGCTMFFLFTGRPPYRKSVDDPEKYLKVVARHLRDPVPDPHPEAPGADDELVELQFEMMAKQPEDRPTYEAIMHRLDRIRARLSGVDMMGSPRPPTATTPDTPEAARARVKRSRAPTDPSSESLDPATGSSSSGSAGGSRVDSLSFARPRRARWLIAITVVCALVFLTGAGLKLFGPLPAPGAAPPPTAGLDGGLGVNLIREDAGPPGPRPLEAPAGMLVVKDASGKPLYFVDRVPVSNSAYKQFKPTHKFAAREANAPAAGVSYDYAVQYARFRQKRLLRASEWRLAMETPNFTPAGMRYWEWVDDGDEGAKDRPVRRVNGGEGRRKPRGDGTTTFRLAQDLPPPR